MMTHVGLLCISTLVVLFIGSFPSCSAKECTHKNIRQCVEDNINFNHCRFNQRIVDCLDTIEGCTDDKLINSIVRQRKYFDETAKLCPGLAEGDCLFEYLKRCDKDIPDFGYRPTMSLPENQHKCTILKSKASEAKKCMKALFKKCPNERSQYRVYPHMLQNVDKVKDKEALCGI